jgi:rRNA maturation endonuclease Nob1
MTFIKKCYSCDIKATPENGERCPKCGQLFRIEARNSRARKIRGDTLPASTPTRKRLDNEPFIKRDYRKCYCCGYHNPKDSDLIFCVSCGRRLRKEKTRYGPDRKKLNELLPESTTIPLEERTND